MLQRIEDVRLPERIAVLPSGWTEDGIWMGHARVYHKHGQVRVVHSIDLADGKWWDHVSVSRKRKIPSWEDLARVKDVIIGKRREAIQVLPREEDYVNVCEYCLHFWAEREVA